MSINKINNILVTGSNGQLGSEIMQISKFYDDVNFFFTDSKSLNIIDFENLRKSLIDNDITVIFNCAAYTNVDLAESEKVKANLVNHLCVDNLARLSLEFDIKLIHISTDYVFDGMMFEPYIEDDIANPQSVYGKTKLAGEKAMQKINPKNSIIIRTSWVYSGYGNNFVKTMLRLAKEKDSLNIIFDQVGTPTYAKDLAKTILNILPQIENEKVEIYHYTNEGVASWYDFAKAIFEIKKISCSINPISTQQYPTPAQRPSYSLLNKSKIKQKFNIEISHWRDSLNEALKFF